MLFLTKGIGTGIVATALKREKAKPDDVAAATESMLTLNRAAAEMARGGRWRARGDGYHRLRAARAWQRDGREERGRDPHLGRCGAAAARDAESYAGAGYIAGGLGRNRAYFAGQRRRDPVRARRRSTSQTILFDPQTSGGLLFAVDPDQAEAFRGRVRQGRIAAVADWRGRRRRGH